MARKHGTSSGYRGGCRCAECREAQRLSLDHYRRQRAYGRPTSNLVNAEPVRQHVREQMSAGLTYRSIARQAGVSQAAVQRLLYGTPRSGYGPSKKMNRDAAEALMSTRASLDTLPEGSLVDPTGTRRRSLSMAMLGHSLTWQAQQIGFGDRHHGEALRTGRVTAGMARGVRDLFSRVWDKPAPDSWVTDRVRRWAVSQGGLPPLAWDDALIDLPDEELAVEVARQISTWDDAELAEAYRAYSRKGDRSPLMVAGSSEYRRRQRSKDTARSHEIAA